MERGCGNHRYDELNELRVGDRVRLAETRPQSIERVRSSQGMTRPFFLFQFSFADTASLPADDL